MSVAVLLIQRVPQAQPAAEPNPQAVALFQEARVLMANGKFGAACPKLEESLGIEWGIGTLFRLSECYENLGRLASAWAGYRDVAILSTVAGQPERAKVAFEQASTMEPKLSKLRIAVAPEAAASGVVLERDGLLVSSVVWGTEVPVDPGNYRVSASAPGKAPWSDSVVIKEPGKVVTVRVPVLVAAPQASAANAGAAPAAPMRVTAEDAKAAWLYEEGMTAASTGQWDKARDSLLSAWRVRQDWQVAIQLGRAELMTGKHRDAAGHIEHYLRNGPRGVSSFDRQSAQELLNAATSKLGRLVIGVDVQNAEVLVDGQAVGRAPLPGPVLVDPGRRAIEARQEGRAPVRSSVEVVAGQSYPVSLSFSEVRQTGMEPSLSAGNLADSAVGPRKPIVIAGIATGAAAVGAGVVFAVLSSAKGSEADELSARIDHCRSPSPEDSYSCARLNELRDSQNLLGSLSFWSFLTGGVIGAGTAAYVLLAPEPAAKSQIHARPVATPQGAGLVVTGVW